LTNGTCVRNWLREFWITLYNKKIGNTKSNHITTTHTVELHILTNIWMCGATQRKSGNKQ
jgi:hypothetical protein